MVYRLLTSLIRPFLPAYLRWRAWRGKEDPLRIGERYGRAVLPRPRGRVYWLHAASVGESVSALVLATSLLKKSADENDPATILMTSGTVTSAAMLAERSAAFGGRLIHQYVPLDIAPWINRFLRHWQPDLAVMVEGDLWPEMIRSTAAQGIPLAMASAQISEKSLRFWTGSGSGMAEQIFPAFDAIFAVDTDHAERFSRLPVKPDAVQVGGSLKAAAMPLADNPEIMQKLNAAANGRRIILLASSHDGDEALFINALDMLVPHEALAVIAPRHPARAKAILSLLEERGISCRRRSEAAWPEATDGYWLADRIGEMGGLIRAADMIVLGGGFTPLGGHNPMEMAALGKGVISGPQVFKNNVAFDLLAQRDGVIFCNDSHGLREALDLLIASPTRLERLNTGAFNAWKSRAHDADRIADSLIARVKEAG